MAHDEEWRWLRGEYEHALDSFAAGLDGLDGSTKVPNLDWTVAELTAHLASMPRLYRAQHGLGEAFEPPEDWAVFSIEQRDHIDTTDLPAVAELLRKELLGFADEIEAHDDIDAARWLYGQSTTHRNVIAGVLTELIVHGQDLGRLTGSSPTLTRRQAIAGIPAMFALVPAFIDTAKAAKAAGVYHLKFRGGDDWTYRISDGGELTVEKQRPQRPDAHLLADPATFVLVALGRRNQITPALTGQMIVWGRRPWKFLATADITVGGF